MEHTSIMLHFTEQEMQLYLTKRDYRIVMTQLSIWCPGELGYPDVIKTKCVPVLYYDCGTSNEIEVFHPATMTQGSHQELITATFTKELKKTLLLIT